MTPFLAPSYSVRGNETWARPSRNADWAFNFILEQLLATDLQRCTEQHREVRFHSGSTCWKTTNILSPPGSTSTLPRYLSGCFHCSWAKIILCHISLTKSNVMFNWAWKGQVVLFWYTSPTYSLPVLRLPMSFCLFFCLWFYFFFILLSCSRISASDQPIRAKNPERCPSELNIQVSLFKRNASYVTL